MAGYALDVSFSRLFGAQTHRGLSRKHVGHAQLNRFLKRAQLNGAEV